MWNEGDRTVQRSKVKGVGVRGYGVQSSTLPPATNTAGLIEKETLFY